MGVTICGGLEVNVSRVVGELGVALRVFGACESGTTPFEPRVEDGLRRAAADAFLFKMGQGLGGMVLV